MYKPKDDRPQHANSVWVPLARLDWTAKGHWEGPATGPFTQPQPDDGSGFLTPPTTFPFPEWPQATAPQP